MKQLFAFKSHYQKIKEFYNRYERWLMPVTLGVGFLIDYITFVSIQINTALTILFVYWAVAALVILFIHAFDAGKIPEKLRYFRLFAPLLVQFLFGGLLGNSFIFYWFSGSVWVSWPFILIFVSLMVLSDALRRHFLKPTAQLALYFFLTLSIFSVSLPFAFNSLNPRLFDLALLIALVFIFIFTWFLSSFSQNVKQSRRHVFVSVALIYLTMTFLYYLNFIPPVPLAVREAGVYHSVQREGSKYVLKAEKESVWDKLMPGQTFYLYKGERTYIYTAIFAPKALNTTIYHHWQYYDEAKEEWVEKDRLGFVLTGGRKEGFRGYSWKSVLAAGKWRVYVKTSRGQTLGVIKFKIEKTEKPVELVEEVR